MDFDKCVTLSNYHVHHLKNFSMPLCSQLQRLPYTPSNHCTYHLPFPEYSINGTIQDVAFRVCFLSLSITLFRFSHVGFFSPEKHSVVWLCQFIYLISWWTFGLFRVFSSYESGCHKQSHRVFVWMYFNFSWVKS